MVSVDTLGLVGQCDTQILEIVMDNVLDLNVALPWWVCKVLALAFR